MISVDEFQGNVRFAVHVQPRASRTEVAGVHGDALKVRLQAPPVDGEANEALIALLARVLSRPPRSVSIMSGPSSRLKRVVIAGITADELRQRLFPESDVAADKEKARR